METLFMAKPVKRDQFWIGYPPLILRFFKYFESFLRKLTKKYPFGSKNWLSQKEGKNCSVINIFSTSWKSDKSKEKFGLDRNNLFLFNHSKWHISTKMVFFLQMSHIQLNLAFQMFWNIFVEIDWKLLFW